MVLLRRTQDSQVALNVSNLTRITLAHLVLRVTLMREAILGTKNPPLNRETSNLSGRAPRVRS